MSCPPLDPADCLIPDWPAPANVRALCTTRVGGVSTVPYDSLNLGSHVGDDAARVQRNRAHLQQTLAVRPVFLDQVHGTEIRELAADTPDGLTADAACTRARGVACTIMVADCLPILLCDAQGSQVAAVHAGWRGLAGLDGIGVVEQAVQRFRPPALVEYGQSAIELIAWLGPASDRRRSRWAPTCGMRSSAPRRRPWPVSSRCPVASGWRICRRWRVSACGSWASRRYLATTAARPGVP